MNASHQGSKQAPSAWKSKLSSYIAEENTITGPACQEDFKTFRNYVVRFELVLGVLMCRNFMKSRDSLLMSLDKGKPAPFGICW